MADFKTALEALANGKLDMDTLSRQLNKLLKDNPKYAGRMLTQLDHLYDRNKISDHIYADVKRQINQFRRAHSEKTEGSVAPPTDEATVFAQEDNVPPPPEQTEAPATEDSTQILTEDEISEAITGMDTSSVDFDISITDTGATSAASVTGATGPAGTEWQPPQPASYHPGRDLDIGDVIKERFKLLDVLGVGGMGKVFKGIDLLKEEARDKNPYVAIKLLNEDFKSHPEAFISLQRESSRQQKLAHPNIATVYDFDRIGGPGTPVYITMELMEGQPLNNYIKKVVRKQGGLPFPEAFEITRQLAAALSYAHERRLVHSDFKPGNAFLCNDGTVKTLDFGIARAVKNPVTGEAEKTLFDPGKLGALTPAYASLEMLDGEEPDTRDDIYALGCVAYELLTGKHPFNKLPANTACENKLVPAPVKGLNKKQNRALRHALGFHRKDRSQTVEDFIEEFEGKATWYKSPITIAAAILIIVGLIATGPAMNFLHDREIQAMVDQINAGDKQVIVAKLGELRNMPLSDQNTVTKGAQEAIQNYFKTEIAQYINITKEDYNFPAANRILKDVEIFYPGSIFLQAQKNEIEYNQKQKVTDLYNQFIAALNDPNSIDKTKDILETIRTKINPKHELLTDARPANAYRLLAEQAFDDGDLNKALNLITSALQTAPKDARLLDLQSKVNRAVEIAQLNDSLGKVKDQLVSMSDFKAHKEEIIDLAKLVSTEDSPVLSALSTNLKQASAVELKRILDQGSRADAEALVSDFGNLLSVMQLGRELAQFKLAHLTGTARTQAIQELVVADKSVIDNKMAGPNIDDEQWEADLLASVRELDSLKEEDPAIAKDLQNYRESIAKLYIDNANKILEENRFDAADSLISRGLRFAPDLAALKQAGTRISAGRTAYEKQLRVADLKDQFKVQTDADRVADAQKIFNQLKTELGSNDPFITDQAPGVLAKSYLRLAQKRKESGDVDNALKFAQAGLKLTPDSTALEALRDDVQVDVYIKELTQLFKTATSLDANEIVEKVKRIEEKGPQRYPAFVKEAETALVARINSLAATDKAGAITMANTAYSIFPESSVLEELTKGQTIPAQVKQAVTQARSQVSSGELNAALQTLNGIASSYAGLPDVISTRRQLETRMRQASDYYDSLKSQLENARSQPKPSNERKAAFRKLQGEFRNRVYTLWNDSVDISKTMSEINSEVATILAKPKPVPTEGGDVVVTKNIIPSDRPCTTDLAGYGKRSRAVCADFVNSGWYGPQMVVIPAGGGFNKDFAISRYEISVQDWSKYCLVSGKCKPESDKDKQKEPVTGISLQQIKDYLEWLSKRTGKTYRLPTKQEWTYAAEAGGKQAPRGNINCRVMLGDKILKGTAPNPVSTGDANGWGLKNYLGNVQEVVTDPSGNVAVGGAYDDPQSDCDISLQKPFAGGGDDRTGFRVLTDDLG